VLLRLAYLIATNLFALLRLLPVSDRVKGRRDPGATPPDHRPGIVAGRDPTAVPSADRAFLAALLHRLPRHVLGRFRLLVRPDTVLRWHRDLIAGRHAARSRPKRPGRPRTVRSIHLLVLRLAKEKPCRGYRRIHSELLVLGIKTSPDDWPEGGDPCWYWRSDAAGNATWGAASRPGAAVHPPGATPAETPGRHGHHH